MSAATSSDTVLHRTVLTTPSVVAGQAYCSVLHPHTQSCHTVARLTTSISELCCTLSLISASSRAILAVRMAKLFSRSLQGQALLQQFSVQNAPSCAVFVSTTKAQIA